MIVVVITKRIGFELHVGVSLNILEKIEVQAIFPSGWKIIVRNVVHTNKLFSSFQDSITRRLYFEHFSARYVEVNGRGTTKLSGRSTQIENCRNGAHAIEIILDTAHPVEVALG